MIGRVVQLGWDVAVLYGVERCYYALAVVVVEQASKGRSWLWERPAPLREAVFSTPAHLRISTASGFSKNRVSSQPRRTERGNVTAAPQRGMRIRCSAWHVQAGLHGNAQDGGESYRLETGQRPGCQSAHRLHHARLERTIDGQRELSNEGLVHHIHSE